jgi:hypothetical protein
LTPQSVGRSGLVLDDAREVHMLRVLWVEVG